MHNLLSKFRIISFFNKGNILTPIGSRLKENSILLSELNVNVIVSLAEYVGEQSDVLAIFVLEALKFPLFFTIRVGKVL